MVVQESINVVSYEYAYGGGGGVVLRCAVSMENRLNIYIFIIHRTNFSPTAVGVTLHNILLGSISIVFASRITTKAMQKLTRQQ